MKKFLRLSVLCGLTVFLLTGCNAQTEYQHVAGNLEQLDSKTVSMQTADGQALCFQLAPETLVYREEGRELAPGDEIKVVFDGKLEGTDTKGVSVIAVSTVD